MKEGEKWIPKSQIEEIHTKIPKMKKIEELSSDVEMVTLIGEIVKVYESQQKFKLDDGSGKIFLIFEKPV
ncbi:MAG: hypothetical protein ACOCP8_08090, partial [archaeon]